MTCMKKLNAMKVDCTKMNVLHLKSNYEAIALDDYCEFILDTGKTIKIEKMKNLRDLFTAANVSNN
jgi:hypothetical protein